MPKITEYCVVIAGINAVGKDTITELVNTKIAGGWQPYGNLTALEDYRKVAQPMVKYE